MKMEICGCGTNHDAIATAQRMVDAIRFIKGDPSTDCVIWHTAVSEAFATMMAQVFGQDLLATARRMMGEDFNAENVHKIGDNQLYELRQRVLLGFVNNVEANTKLLTTITDRFCIEVVNPNEILDGPPKEALTAAGIVNTSDLSGDAVELLKELGAKVVMDRAKAN